MTERLYYDDAYLWEFDGTVTAVRPGKKQGTWEVALDRSAFYPTSGGQPFDTGKLVFSGKRVYVGQRIPWNNNILFLENLFSSGKKDMMIVC